jgi:hypothetical protein
MFGWSPIRRPPAIPTNRMTEIGITLEKQHSLPFSSTEGCIVWKSSLAPISDPYRASVLIPPQSKLGRDSVLSLARENIAAGWKRTPSLWGEPFSLSCENGQPLLDEWARFSIECGEETGPAARIDLVASNKLRLKRQNFPRTFLLCLLGCTPFPRRF